MGMLSVQLRLCLKDVCGQLLQAENPIAGYLLRCFMGSEYLHLRLRSPVMGLPARLPSAKVTAYGTRNRALQIASGALLTLTGRHEGRAVNHFILEVSHRDTGRNTALSHLAAWYTVTNRSGSLPPWVIWQEKRPMPATPTSKAHSYFSKASRLISSARLCPRFTLHRSRGRSAFSSARCSAR